MRSFLLCVLFSSVASIANASQPILDDAMVRGYFADVLRQGGFGHWKTERAAFLVRQENGQYRCIAWPLDGHLYQQNFHGLMPARTVAIIHTHPSERPRASAADERTAAMLSLPVFVLTPRNLYMITAEGVSVAVFENREWASSLSSVRCK